MSTPGEAAKHDHAVEMLRLHTERHNTDADRFVVVALRMLPHEVFMSIWDQIQNERTAA